MPSSSDLCQVSKDSTISSEELRHALKQRFHIEMSDETTKAVMREFDADGDGEGARPHRLGPADAALPAVL